MISTSTDAGRRKRGLERAVQNHAPDQLPIRIGRFGERLVASQAIDSECGSLHGIAIQSDRLPSPTRDAILEDLRVYLTTVLDQECPDMQRRKESQAADARFQLLWQTVETVNKDPADNQIRGQLLSLLAAAHQSRETRLFQMTQSVPGLIWGLLIVFASGLIYRPRSRWPVRICATSHSWAETETHIDVRGH
jgi:hypothetical protein